MWTHLKETYDKLDRYDIFNLHNIINSVNQNGSALSNNYHNFNTLWKQFDVMIRLPACTYDATKQFDKA